MEFLCAVATHSRPPRWKLQEFTTLLLLRRCCSDCSFRMMHWSLEMKMSAGCQQAVAMSKMALICIFWKNCLIVFWNDLFLIGNVTSLEIVLFLRYTYMERFKKKPLRYSIRHLYLRYCSHHFPSPTNRFMNKIAKQIC